MRRSARTLALAATLLCDTALVGAQTATTAATASAFAASACPTILRPSYDNPVVGSGWTAQLIAQGLTAPRGIAFDRSGALLVVQQGSGIVRMTFADNGGTCLVVNQTRALVNNTDVSEPFPTPLFRPPSSPPFFLLLSLNQERGTTCLVVLNVWLTVLMLAAEPCYSTVG